MPNCAKKPTIEDVNIASKAGDFAGMLCGLSILQRIQGFLCRERVCCFQSAKMEDDYECLQGHDSGFFAGTRGIA